jgi:UDP-N-acetyl-D-mannosaminuronic acid transferase (WecB/TagA/CpsF family)
VDLRNGSPGLPLEIRNAGFFGDVQGVQQVVRDSLRSSIDILAVPMSMPR